MSFIGIETMPIDADDVHLLMWTKRRRAPTSKNDPRRSC